MADQAQGTTCYPFWVNGSTSCLCDNEKKKKTKKKKNEKGVITGFLHQRLPANKMTAITAMKSMEVVKAEASELEVVAEQSGNEKKKEVRLSLRRRICFFYCLKV